MYRSRRGCRSDRSCRASPLRRTRTPPTSENARIRTVGAPGPGSGPASILVPPIRLNPDTSTRIPRGDRDPDPAHQRHLGQGDFGGGQLCLAQVKPGAADQAEHDDMAVHPPPPGDSQAADRRDVPGWPGRGTLRDGGPGRAPAGSAGRSPTRRSSSARVLAAVARSIRWLNSARVSRPSPVAALSRSMVASRSASDARTSAARLAVACGPAHCRLRPAEPCLPATTIAAGRCAGRPRPAHRPAVAERANPSGTGSAGGGNPGP